LSENTSSGIFVSESLSSGQPIPVRRDTVAAFLGPAPRGPVGIPVTIGGIDEYLQRFGVSGHDGPLLEVICQFFANGGKNATVVRVCSSARRHHIVFPGPSGALTLEAINPGPYELLRASIDYDGILPTDLDRFNLVIHRLTSRVRPIIERQEVYHGLSVDITDPDFIGHALLGSELVSIKEEIPEQRPDITFCDDIEIGTSYIYVDPEWAETDHLTDYDLIGCNTEGTGLFALDQIPSVDIVSLVTDEQDPGPVALFAAERYCRKQNAILLVDPPTHWQSVGSAIRLARKSDFMSPNVVSYFPRPINSKQQPASVIGALAGTLVSSDARAGVWGMHEDAQLQMRGRVQLPFDLNVEEQQALKRVGINSLRITNPSHLELSGLVTLNRGYGCAAEWDKLSQRRTALFILDNIARSTQWAAFQENNSETWSELRDQVRYFLYELFAEGALFGANAADAGYVICNQQTNSDSTPVGESGISFVVGFMPRGQGMHSFRFHQLPVECRIQTLHIEDLVALAS
jgi:hypothetical protein